LRSSREVAFRLRQELKNLYLWKRPPRIKIAETFAPLFPAPSPVEVSSAREIVELAAAIRCHRFPIFGQILDTGPEIRWRRDYQRGIETGLEYFRTIPYLDAARAGDHKLIWELNRHQHLVTLAQAWLSDGNEANLAEIQTQIESWLARNPFQRGINWASALEVAMRGMSWMWVHRSTGRKLPAEFRARWLHALYLHGCHIENNLSIYFSPNTHLLGEALALHQLGLFFCGYARAARWESLGAMLMREQMERQVRADGSHFEQSSYYHVYALDMFLQHATLASPDGPYMDKLERMADYLRALLGPAGVLPFLGDDDGGRLFHPYGPRDLFGRATLATASVVLNRQDWRCKPGEGKWESRLFRDAGLAVMVSGDNQVLVDAGGFGPWGAGHSHADALSVLARAGDEEILIDPGTYTYVGDARWRDWFRGTAAHNTIRVDGIDQAEAKGPFRWSNHPRVKILSWTTSGERDVIEAECRYAGFVHRRRVEFHKPDQVSIADHIDGPPGQHLVEQFWHLGSLAARGRLDLAEGSELLESWRSTVFGEKHPAPLARVMRRGALPMRLDARIRLG
jgi:hypothetical protein